jgi:hypothetical protein
MSERGGVHSTHRSGDELDKMIVVNIKRGDPLAHVCVDKIKILQNLKNRT